MRKQALRGHARSSALSRDQIRKRTNLVFFCLILILLGVVLTPRAIKAQNAPSNWQWITCDVGQGDAHLIRTGKHSAVLLDTGDNPSSLESCLNWAGVQELDGVVLTHEHSDHYGAYSWCLNALPVGTVVVNPYFSQTALNQLTHNSSQQVGPIPQQLSAQENSRVSFPTTENDSPTVSGEVLWPPGEPTHIPGEPSNSSWTNNTSLVIRWQVHPVDPDQVPLSVLTTGDLEADAAHSLVESHGSALSAQVLKIAHHGSQGSGTDVIIAAQPQLAVISVGQGNSYGHPHARIIEFLEQQGIAARRTDQKGHIAISSHTDGLHVTTSS